MTLTEQSDDLLAIVLAPAPKTEPRPTVRRSRHFYRCSDCLSVAATDTKLPCVKDKWGYSTDEVNAACDAYNGPIEYMGKTLYTVGGHEYALRHVVGCKPACDGKCIGAIGPNCDCQCGGENHGTGKMVDIYEQGSVPRLKVPSEARTKGEQYRAALETCRAAWTAKFGYVTEKKRSGEWIGNFQLYLDGQYAQQRIAKARHLRVHGTRLKRLAELTAEFGK